MPIRLASYNIRKAVGLDWRRKPDRILAVLDEIAPDIVVLQEADKRLGERPAAIPHVLIETHGAWLPLDPGPGPSLGWHGNAILLRQGLKGEVIDRLTLPGLEPRGALLARLGGAGPDFLLVAAHLGLDRASRRRQIAAILQAAGSTGLPMVIAGDLNTPRPARLLNGEGQDLTVVTPGPSFHASQPMLALDHMLLGRGVQLVGCGVHQSPLARVASDHLPIWADLELPDPALAIPSEKERMFCHSGGL
ncbi:Metal-dependent hydrolase [Rubellimicrobium thermophilum DSM 16684]|uniref:Metal-dependent hydrolase n=1 Tax=Rubellimicrobium thermophilum DSM 16684 TaxID=1123069 RepID=S9SIQ7_9RHOB|nr:endonuclease/exonuclease/phosphatase family protein [Rubellimicrobium thermophilum]EPX86239.1 Metal-dependent hydrolase [Rubellimicrobium thermophilum DSM 16684]